jgi:hypothetical protein
VFRQQRVDDLGHDRVGIADHAGKDRAAAAKPLDEVDANFVLDAGVTWQPAATARRRPPRVEG